MSVEVSTMTNYYELEIQSFPNGMDLVRYGIGVFRTRQEAEDTATRYLSDVPGFRDYYCEYTIRESSLITDAKSVCNFTGWNEDDVGNEIDIFVSPLYADPRSAERAMKKIQAELPRKEWCLNHWTVGKCDWDEGFIRDFPDGRLAPTLKELRDSLQALIEPRTICGIEYEYSDGAYYGFPLAVAQQLFLMAVDDDFLLNGFTVRRLRDIYQIGERKGIYQTIAEREGLTNFEVPGVDISSWEGVFRSLQALGKNIIIEREYEPDFFRLGRIEKVERDHVLFRHFDADGIWMEPAPILYRDITSVTFDDRYAEILSKYV